MKKFIALTFIALSLNSFGFSEDFAKEEIFKAVYAEHLCDQAEYYTESVCTGAFLDQGLVYDSKYSSFEIEFEFEPGFFLHAIAFEDGEVTVSYYTKN